MSPHPRHAVGPLLGVGFALAAGLMWGLVFVGPLLLPEYPATLQAFGRYLAFGLIALPLGGFDRARLRQLARADWLEALQLALVGNVIYYLLLASAIQRAGAPVPTMIIGTLPVVITVVTRWRWRGVDAKAHAAPRLAWRRLLPSLALIGLGLGLVNHVEWLALRSDSHADPGRYALGALLAVGAVVCWTWYPLRNARWLRAHPDRSARAWATAQGLATLPLALLGYAATWAWHAAHADTLSTPLPMPFGPRPGDFLLLMFAIGLFASWLGTLCWNEASQRLAPALAGQLIVFETLAALGYAFALRQQLPPPQTLLGIALLVAGVVWAVRSQAGLAQPDVQAAAHPN